MKKFDVSSLCIECIRLDALGSHHQLSAMRLPLGRSLQSEVDVGMSPMRLAHVDDDADGAGGDEDDDDDDVARDDIEDDDDASSWPRVGSS